MTEKDKWKDYHRATSKMQVDVVDSLQDCEVYTRGVIGKSFIRGVGEMDEIFNHDI